MSNPADHKTFASYSADYEDQKGEKPHPFYTVSQYALSEGFQTEEQALIQMEEELIEGDCMRSRVRDWPSDLIAVNFGH